MDNHDFYLFKRNVKENTSDEEQKKGGISVESLNFDRIKFSIKGDGIIDLRSAIEMQEFMEEILKYRAQVLNFIIQYHPDSPRYWRPVDYIEREEEEDVFQLSINLGEFITSNNQKKYEGMDFYIPDNYELSKVVEKEFKKALGSLREISGNHYRELAVWESNDTKALEALGDFIEKKYVAPKLKEIMESLGIKGVKFDNNKIDFIYETEA